MNSEAPISEKPQTSNWGPAAFVSAVVIIGFYVTLWMAMNLPPERPLGEVLASLIGALSMAFGAVVNYYLGSSIGSTHKTELLSKSKNP